MYLLLLNQSLNKTKEGPCSTTTSTNLEGRGRDLAKCNPNIIIIPPTTHNSFHLPFN